MSEMDPGEVERIAREYLLGVSGNTVEANKRRLEIAVEGLREGDERDTALRADLDAFFRTGPTESERQARLSSTTWSVPEDRFYDVREHDGAVWWAASARFEDADDRDVALRWLEVNEYRADAPVRDVVGGEAPVADSVRVAAQRDDAFAEFSRAERRARRVVGRRHVVTPEQEREMRRVDEYAIGLGLQPMTGATKRLQYDSTMSRYGVLAGSHELLVERGGASEEEYQRRIVDPARQITNPNTWRMLGADARDALEPALQRAAEAEQRAARWQQIEQAAQRPIRDRSKDRPVDVVSQQRQQ